jgi:hypothetical protein
VGIRGSFLALVIELRAFDGVRELVEAHVYAYVVENEMTPKIAIVNIVRKLAAAD